jgi:hypothetical protein
MTINNINIKPENKEKLKKIIKKFESKNMLIEDFLADIYSDHIFILEEYRELFGVTILQTVYSYHSKDPTFRVTKKEPVTISYEYKGKIHSGGEYDIYVPNLISNYNYFHDLILSIVE